MLRYRVPSADGRRVEHNTPIGLVRKFPKDKDAWREVDRLGILIRINDAPSSSRIRFNSLAEHYLKADFGADAVRPKSENSTSIMEHIVRDYLIARWGDEIAEDIKPLDIQRWLKSLNTESKLAWTTIAKMRGDHEPHLQGRHTARAGHKKSCAALSRHAAKPTTGLSSSPLPRRSTF